VKARHGGGAKEAQQWMEGSEIGMEKIGKFFFFFLKKKISKNT
jgi:hypothetical protein